MSGHFVPGTCVARQVAFFRKIRLVALGGVGLGILALGLPGCARGASSPGHLSASATRGIPTSARATAPQADPRLAPALAILSRAEEELGPQAAAAIRARIEARPKAFLDLLDSVLAERAFDPGRFARVDKAAPPLASDFEPGDLVSLDGIGPAGGRLHVSRAGHRLRKGAVDALLAMDAAAKAAGLDLMISSSFRGYAYQGEVFARSVASDGEEEAKRNTAEPGRSQHQLGTAMDFGSIDDDFANTAAFVWLSAQAAEFGFSLSYPEGLEAVTGYRHESWHWRWLGVPALRLQQEFFGDVQQYLIVYLSRV